MVKIKQSSKKNDLLKKRQNLINHQKYICQLATQNETELEQWLERSFSEFSTEAKEGLEVIVKTLWANSNIISNSLTKHN